MPGAPPEIYVLFEPRELAAPRERQRIEVLLDALNAVGLDAAWPRDEHEIRHFPPDRHQLVLAFVTRRAMESRLVRHFLDDALERSLHVAPVLLKPVELPMRLAARQVLDLSEWDGTPEAWPVRNFVDRVLHALDSIRSERASEPPVPPPEAPALPQRLTDQLAARQAAYIAAAQGIDDWRDATGYSHPPAPAASVEYSRADSHPPPGLLQRILYFGAIASLLLLGGWLAVKFVPVMFGMTGGNGNRREPTPGAPSEAPAASADLPEAPAGTEPGRDHVDCSAFAPPQVARGGDAIVQVFLHLPMKADEALERARLFDDETKLRAVESLSLPLRRGDRVGVELSVPGLEVQPETCREITWNGSLAGTSFSVVAPEDVATGRRTATARLFVEGVPLGVLYFRIEVVEVVSDANEPEGVGELARRYRRAFVSYASSDRAEVLKRVQMMAALGVDFFQDVLDFEPGDRWERALYREIDRCDLFLLFWSSAARDSKWVREEARYALQRQHGHEDGLPDIVPMILEGPPPPAPWEEFSALHFNDSLIYLIRLEERDP